MMIRQARCAFAFLLLTLSVWTAPAWAVEGYYGKVWMGEYQGRTVLVLQDERDNQALFFLGTPDYCERRGDSYSKFRRAISNTDRNYRYFWTVTFCTGGTAYVCLDVNDQVSEFRPQACSTFATDGKWDDWTFGRGM